MSIEKYYRYYTAVCDCCGARLPGEERWEDARRAKQAAGWESRKVDGEWEDVCPDCLFEEKGYDNDENNRQTR